MKKQVKRSLGLMCLAAMVMTACQKGKVANPASYLWAALAGFVLGLILNFVVLPPQ